MGSKIDRTGEERLNNFGSKIIIIEYRKVMDIDVYFPEYDWIFKHTRYSDFKKGEIKCPYERRTYGVGYLGEGKYKTKENGKKTKCYNAWHDMLRRCYSEKCHKRQPTYKNCKVRDEWLCFQNFAKWFYENYYEIEGQRMCLDKDIINKGNKIYSPDTSVFVPYTLNLLFTKNDKFRGEYPLGVCYHHDRDKKFSARCSIYNFEENKKKQIHLGYYDTPNEAFEVYKQFKEQNIKEVADYYRDQIPKKLYRAMYEYEVEITD